MVLVSSRGKAVDAFCAWDACVCGGGWGSGELLEEIDHGSGKRHVRI